MAHVFILINVFATLDGLGLTVILSVSVIRKVIVSMKLNVITARTVEITLP
jgi:hypothetical protein